MKRSLLAALLLYLVLATAHLLSPPPPAVDLGQWKLLVIQSDDWGFEGWYPDVESAIALGERTEHLPERLHDYRSSSLETAEELDALAEVLARHRDLDGLPAVFQANVIVGAVDVEGCGSSPVEEPFTHTMLRQPGECGSYARPGRREAEDRAIARGVWHPQLHGLTHYNLEERAAAIARGVEISARATELGAVAFPGYEVRTELENRDAGHAAAFARVTVELFQRRYGRPPLSIMAPDYTWGIDDERAWKANGIEVVQAKHRQLDPAANPTDYWGRLKKVLFRWRDLMRGEMTYLDRWAYLEPYGNPDPEELQGANAAFAQIVAGWDRGEVVCLETHRVQYSNFNPLVPAAGRAQLDLLLTRLENGPGVRYCLDVEIAQLMRRGWSLLERGPWLIVRNYTDGPLHLDLPALRAQPLAPGTHVFPQRQYEDLPAPDG